MAVLGDAVENAGLTQGSTRCRLGVNVAVRLGGKEAVESRMCCSRETEAESPGQGPGSHGATGAAGATGSTLACLLATPLSNGLLMLKPQGP